MADARYNQTPSYPQKTDPAFQPQPQQPPPQPSYGESPPPYESVTHMPAADPGAPVPYESRSTTTTTTTSAPITIQQNPDRLHFQPEYFRTIPAVLQIVEIVLSLLTFICASVDWWGGGQGWVRFVSMSAFLTVLITLIFHALTLNNRFIQWRLYRFIYYCIFTGFYVIAFIVAAAYGSRADSIAASAFFAFAAMGVFAADTFLQFRAWRQHSEDVGSHSAYMTSTVYTTTVTTAHGPVPGQGPPQHQQQGMYK